MTLACYRSGPLNATLGPKVKQVKLAVIALIAVSLAVALAACGDDGVSGPSAHILLEADLSQLSESADPDEAMTLVADIVEMRAKAFGASVEVDIESTNRLSVRLRGVTAEESQELLVKTALLEFREPKVDKDGNIVCTAPDGSQFSVPPAQVSATETGNQRTAQCIGDDGQTGEVLWKPATGTDSQGNPQELTGTFLRPNAEVIGPPVQLSIEFNGEGSLLFEQITTRLVGLPLGMFLDEDLISAPTVMQPIAGGSAGITGLSEDEARVLAIQLNAGALPAPLTVVSVEDTP